MKKLLLLLLLLPAAAFARRDTTDVLVRASLAALETERATAPFYTASPVAMLCRRSESLSRLEVRMELRDEAEPRIEALGDGSLAGMFRAESYLRLDGRSAVQASARYRRGRRDNVRMNSTADYLLLYPHITADTQGGDLTTEEYGFGGGYARRIGRRTSLALQAAYRAEQEYRQVDPRPHNVVLDFSAEAGFGYKTARYLVAVDLKGRLYKQTQQTDFYDPTHVIEEYFMTGPGVCYARYSGKKEHGIVSYDGTTCAVALQLLPKGGTGWHLRTVGEHFAADRSYRPNNAIPVSTLRHLRASLAAAYEGSRASLRAEIGRRQRLGIEQIADRNGQGAIVDRQTTYDQRTTEALLEAALQWQRPSTHYTLSPRIDWQYTEADHLYPMRRLRYSSVDARLNARAERMLPRWRIAAALGIGCYLSPDHTIEIGGEADLLTEQLAPALERLGRRSFYVESALRADRRLGGGTACFFEVEWSPQLLAGGLRSHALTLSCGLLF